MPSPLFALALLVAVTACDPALYAHIEPGSRPDSLVIHAFVGVDSAAGGKSLYEILVSGCDRRENVRDTAWAISRGEGVRSHSEDRRTFFRYGALPSAEWKVQHDAELLSPGCYELLVGGYGLGGVSRFEVDSQGRVQKSP